MRKFFRNEVTGRQGLTHYLARALRLPELKRLEQLVDHAALTPEHQQVTGPLDVLSTAFAVVFRVYACAGPAVLARGVKRLAERYL